VGRLEAVKSYETLLEAAALLRKSWENPFHVVVFGDGRQRDALLARAAQLGISDIVRLPGWCEEPLKAHRLIDVFVLPSQSEGQSVSLLEAMACGSVPVVTDVGANAEMLGPSLRSHVVPPNEPRLLADALGSSSSPERIRAVGLAVRQRVVDHYSVDRMISGYESLYRRLNAKTVSQ
jgi:glycosyltransferase involved in cell wall biosynthesis